MNKQTVKIIKNKNQNKFLVTLGKYFVVVEGNTVSKLNKTELSILEQEEKENILVKSFEVSTLEQFYNIVDKII